VNLFPVIGLLFGGVVVTLGGLGLFFDGYERGHRVGKEQGYQDGFTAGKLRADEWWADAELDVAKARQEIWKEEA
jgi:hypothetical protein